MSGTMELTIHSTDEKRNVLRKFQILFSRNFSKWRLLQKSVLSKNQKYTKKKYCHKKIVKFLSQISKNGGFHRKFCSPEIFVFRILQVKRHLVTPSIPPLVWNSKSISKLFQAQQPQRWNKS